MGIFPKNCMKIDRRLLPVKCHYFFFMAALATVLPFRTIFAKQIGLSGTEVGLVFCVAPVLKIVTNPLFGFIIDFFKRYRLTISVTVIILAFSHVFLIFIPPKSTMSSNMINNADDFYTQIRYSCWQNKTFLDVFHHKLIMYNEYRTIENRSRFICDVECPDSTADSESVDSTDERITEKRNSLNSSTKVRVSIKVLVNVFRCDMDLLLKKADVLVVSNSVQNSMLFSFNDSLTTIVKSLVETFRNCSDELTNSVITRRNENNVKGYFPDVFEKYVSIPVLENKGYDQKMYYNLQDFTFVSQTNSSLLDNNDCNFEYRCKSKCFSSTLNASFLETGSRNFISAQFWGIFVMFSVAGVTISSIIFMMDAVCYEMLQDQKDQYGQQRLWGTVGWGLGAFAAGYLNQIMPTEAGDNYTFSFYLLGVLMFIDIIPICHLKIKDLKYSPNILKDVCFLFTNTEITYNAIILSVIGGLSGLIWNYQFWFMQEIGSSQILLGLSQIFEGVFELPCFFISGWIIRKIGHYNCCSITLLCFGLRYLCFVFMYNPWWSLAAALFHGPTFGLFYASMTMYAKNQAPAGTEATVQSLLHLFFEGIGAAAGSMLGGIGLDTLGSRLSFTYAAGLSFLFLIVNILMTIRFTRTKKRKGEITESVTYAK